MIPVSESVLANLVKKTVSEIKADLVVLELQGLVRKQDGGYVLNWFLICIYNVYTKCEKAEKKRIVVKK